MSAIESTRDTESLLREMSRLGAEDFNRFGAGCLPGHLGIVVTRVGEGSVTTELAVRAELMAPNGYLHAGTVVALADTTAGYGCIVSMPPGAAGFTTIELKSNHLGTARDGTLECVATAVHLGGTTQVWDAVVRQRGADKPLALFRCTQLILKARQNTRPRATVGPDEGRDVSLRC